MEQQQKKRDGPVRCVCEERRASEHWKSAESEVGNGTVMVRGLKFHHRQENTEQALRPDEHCATLML